MNKKQSKKPSNDLSELGKVVGTATGGKEFSTAAGGWAGTDDATSTAPSDRIGTPTPEEDKNFEEIERDFSQAIEEETEQQEALAELVDERQELEELRTRPTP